MATATRATGRLSDQNTALFVCDVQERFRSVISGFPAVADTSRRLALAAYAPGASIKDYAGQLGRTEGAVYQLLSRIRQDLLRCVERTLGGKEQGT